MYFSKENKMSISEKTLIAILGLLAIILLHPRFASADDIVSLNWNMHIDKSFSSKVVDNCKIGTTIIKTDIIHTDGSKILEAEKKELTPDSMEEFDSIHIGNVTINTKSTSKLEVKEISSKKVLITFTYSKKVCTLDDPSQ
jgi:spermidine/putrescine-binding protein